MLNIRHILPFTTPFIIGAVTASDMAIYKEILSKADRCYVVLRHKCEWVTDWSPKHFVIPFKYRGLH